MKYYKLKLYEEKTGKEKAYNDERIWFDKSKADIECSKININPDNYCVVVSFDTAD